MAQSQTFSPSFLGNSGEYGGGVTVYDINNDGWDDVSYPTADDSVLTYINNQGVFELHRFFAQNGDGRQIVFGDYDNDGDADALIATSGGYPSLYEQVGDLEFVDVSYKLNISSMAPSFLSGCNFVDFNQDGLLDIYVSNYLYTSPSRCYLFINNGDGNYTESAADYGMMSENRFILNSVFADFNNDQKLDFWVGNDRTHKEQLFLKNPGNSYSPTTPDASLSLVINTMSVSPCDYDRDGDLDIYLANSEMGNCLMNNTAGAFSNVADATPFELNRFCWGALWIDLHNDMWSDLLVATRENYINFQTKDAILMNSQGVITNQEYSFSFNDVDGTYAFAKGDFNNDFRPDFSVAHDGLTHHEYVINQFTQSHAVGLTLEGTTCNRDAFGSQIHYFVEGQQVNENLYSGFGYCSQNSKRFLLACGNHAGIDSLQVVWPTGQSEWWYNLTTETNFHLVEGEGNKVFADWNSEYAICPNESITLSLPLGLVGVWSNGFVGNELTVTEPGEYFATINGQAQTQTVLVTTEVNALADISFASPHCFDEASGRIELSSGQALSVMINGSSQNLPLNNLGVGTYTIEWISNGGCIYSDEISLSNPEPLAATISTADMVCVENQFSQLNIDQVLNFTYPFDVVLNSSEVITVESESSLPMQIALNTAGVYDLMLIDDLGCQYTTSFVVDLAPILSATIIQTQGGENGIFVAEVNASGGIPPLQYYWNNGVVSDEAIFDIPGSVNCIITDALGCSVEVESEITNLHELATSIVQSGHLFSSTRTMERVDVIDLTGKEIAHFTNCRSWSLDGLAVGVYCLILNNQETIKVWINSNEK